MQLHRVFPSGHRTWSRQSGDMEYRALQILLQIYATDCLHESIMHTWKNHLHNIPTILSCSANDGTGILIFFNSPIGILTTGEPTVLSATCFVIKLEMGLGM